MSKTNEWATPQSLFDKLNMVFGFTLDPCATPKTAKCKKFYTIKDNGLNKSWANEIVFMNPPYGREIGKWIKKAFDEWISGATVVCLIPARTDTSYWHNYIFGRASVRFIKGRIAFGNAKQGAPFPSALVIFKGPSSWEMSTMNQND